MNEFFKIQIEENPSADDLLSIDRDLIQYNEQASSEQLADKHLFIFLRDEKSKIVGGLVGRTIWGWLEVKDLWVESHLRGLGFGTRLMQRAETEARARNCHAAMLDTFSFQALDFYHKLAYVVFGKLDDFPRGHTRYFLRKSLNKNE